MSRPTPERLEELREAISKRFGWGPELFAEINALRAELDEALKNVANARMELECPIVKERDRLAEECKQWSARNLELVVELDRLRELLEDSGRSFLAILSPHTENSSDQEMGCQPDCYCDRHIARAGFAKIQVGRLRAFMGRFELGLPPQAARACTGSEGHQEPDERRSKTRRS